MKKQKFSLRIVTITLFLLYFGMPISFAFDLDETVDDDIRKNYNSSKLIQDTGIEDDENLPELPAKLKNNTVNSDKSLKPKENPTIAKISSASVNGNTKISKGTSFDVISTQKISDWQKKGTSLKFKTTSQAVKKKYSIPAGTVFTGEIIESHQPQLSCNGGLVVIRIHSMNYKGQTIPLNAYITKADEKMIFLNNIKGERTYLKTMWKKGNWGRSIFNQMCSLTVKLGGESSTLLLSPFPFAYGAVCLGANTLVSPITAFFNKGKHVSINSGSKFRIKLLEDSYID